MLKISDFSKLSYVSVKTLRHYDDMGLLIPAQVDKFTGYRYYSAQQITRLHQILALKDLGLSLEEIKHVLEGNPSIEQMRGMLMMKRAQTLQRLQEEQERLQRVEIRIRQLEQEGKMADYEVIIKSVPALKVASIRGVTPDWAHISPTLNGMFDTLFEVLRARNIRHNGIGITLYHDSEYRESDIQLGAAIQISEDVALQDGVSTDILPAFDQMASLVHHGAFSGLPSAYHVMQRWIAENGYEIAGANREINLEYERNGDPEKYVTELQFPVKKRM